MRTTRFRTLAAAVAATACLLSPAVLATPAEAHARSVNDPAVVLTWNAVATRTIAVEHTTPVPASALYLALVHLAAYDAVVSVEGRYEPYLERVRTRGRASARAAAVQAAYDVLRHYFPASAGNLRRDYDASLAGLRGTGRVERGKRVGAAAAAAVIASRVGDGRDAAVTFDRPPAPGVWRPTPDAQAPMLTPWLGFVRPLLLRSPPQLALPGPDAIGTAAYAKDLREVRRLGAKDGSRRTAAQTETALFWNANAVLQYQVAMRTQVERRGLDLAEAARAFALLGSTTADALIAAWRAKSDHAYWRPVTAIRLAHTDGNPRTRRDADWSPLLATPPYPEYVSGHAAATGAASGTLSHLFGRRHIDLDVASPGLAPRHFATAAALDRETMNARIWLGFHFRKAMTDGNRLGHDVVDVAVARHFRPTGRRD